MINEQDLFNYVFYPDLVNEKTKAEIGEDKTLLPSIEFYIQLKKNKTTEIDRDLKQKLAAKIPAYTISKQVQLFHLNDNIGRKSNGSRLAAESRELKPKLSTKTFIDSDKEYLIKVLDYGTETKIFVFSTKDEVIKDFEIIIKPNDVTYKVADNSEPLILSYPVEIESIELKFN